MAMMSAGANALIGGNKGPSGLIVGGGLAAMSMLKAWKKIPTGEMGVRTRLDRPLRQRGKHAGELYGIVGPGWKPIIPFTDGIKTISIQDRENDLERVYVNSEDEEQLEVNASITWGVRADGDNPFRALYNINTQEALVMKVTNFCATGVYRAMNGIKRHEMDDYEKMDETVKTICFSGLIKYGVELRELEIKNVTETPAQVLTRNREPNYSELGSLGTAVPSLFSFDLNSSDG